MGIVTMGVDFGQRRDPTAVCVIEREWWSADNKKREHHLVRHLERLPLGTPYPAVAARVAAVAAGIVERTHQRPKVYLDATGLGTPVCDILKDARVPGDLVPVYFTHGDRCTMVEGEMRLGKAFLVSRLQALLQSGEIHLPNTDEARALAKELLDYEIRVDEAANDRYGAFRVGKHDDLVTALGLAVQAGPVANPLAGMAVQFGARGWVADSDRGEGHLINTGSGWEPARKRIDMGRPW